MMRFISLGSGSSGNCYCLFTENDGLMIDAGIGTRLLKKFFNEYGISNDTEKVDKLKEAVIEQILLPFLRRRNFEMPNCVEVMDRIFEISKHSFKTKYI